MKTIIAAIVLFTLVAGAHAQLTTNLPARWPNKVEGFAKGRQIGLQSSSIAASPEMITVGNEETDTCTSPGVEHTLKWKFIGREQNYDVYQFTFTRMTKAGSSLQTTSSREVPFDGKRFVVFDDDLHTIVMESPSTNELKAVEDEAKQTESSWKKVGN